MRYQTRRRTQNHRAQHWGHLIRRTERLPAHVVPKLYYLSVWWQSGMRQDTASWLIFIRVFSARVPWWCCLRNKGLSHLSSAKVHLVFSGCPKIPFNSKPETKKTLFAFSHFVSLIRQSMPPKLGSDNRYFGLILPQFRARPLESGEETGLEPWSVEMLAQIMWYCEGFTEPFLNLFRIQNQDY